MLQASVDTHTHTQYIKCATGRVEPDMRAVVSGVE